MEGQSGKEGLSDVKCWNAENELRKQYPDLSMENRLSETEQGQMATGQDSCHLLSRVLTVSVGQDFTLSTGWHSGTSWYC